VFLLAHDSDPFNRWEAAQAIATELLKGGTEAARTGGTPVGDPDFVRGLGTIAEDDSLEPAYRALALQLPAESDIFREIGSEVDPAAIAVARRALKAEIGRGLADTFERLYDDLADDAPYTPDAASTGRRALQGSALDYLVTAGIEGAEARAVAHFDTARNMTDRLAALTTLAMNRLPSAEAAFATYAEIFEGDALAMDKWLSMQAMIPEDGNLDRVRKLMDHPAFSFANPNRVRALIGAFATGNPVAFHNPDGTGYHFLATVVIELDGKNPQVAARLLAAFRSWRMLEPGRRALAKAELERVAERPGLSTDTSDIVTRILG
jgi:aminopeptidase N